MHPNRAFHSSDEGEMLAFIGEVAFATICVDGPALVHAPLMVAGPDSLIFHVSLGNRALDRLEGARAIASVLGPDCYISPDWYESSDQVPTWNYVALEAEGPLRRLDRAELPDMLDRLTRLHEERLAPKPAWTRDEMAPARFEGLVNAIAGFELKIEALRGTRKLGQHKGLADRRRVADALAALGRDAEAELMRP
jgi:transcriptional regulator